MRPRRHPLAVPVTGAVAVALAGSGLIAGPAGAAPTALETARAQAALIEAQLELRGRHISELDERYNQARLAAERAERTAAGAQRALAASRARFRTARTRLARHARAAYVHGGAAPLLDQLVRTQGPDFGVRRRYVETALDAADRAVRDVVAARRELVRLDAALSRARDASRDAVDRVASERAAAAGAAELQRATLARVRADVARLVADDATRAAAESARRVRTALARARVSAPGAPASPRAPAPAPRAPVAPPGPGPRGGGNAGDLAVTEAAEQLGKPYEWAGAGPDTFDCSGLTMWAWRAAGVRLSHSAEYQFRETRRVPLTELQPGDLLFFGDPIHHVGIYVGDGMMIEAPHTGALVRYRSIWRNDLIGAGRP
jgi:cell wall-associated NlpC family hydrolase